MWWPPGFLPLARTLPMPLPLLPGLLPFNSRASFLLAPATLHPLALVASPKLGLRHHPTPKISIEINYDIPQTNNLMSTCRVIVITKFYVVVDVEFKELKNNLKIGKYGSNFRSSKLSDFRWKWPEITTSLKNWHLSQRYVSLPAWHYDFPQVAFLPGMLFLYTPFFFLDTITPCATLISNILFFTLSNYWATSVLWFNFCVCLGMFCSNNPKKQDQKENEGPNRPKK
jgi:hypothetical protein